MRPPALLHFSVADVAPAEEDMDPRLTYGSHRTDLRPVTAHVIELPIEKPCLGRPWNTFTPHEQMRAIIGTEGLHQQFPPYHPLDQHFRRFNDYVNSLWEWKGSIFYYIRQTESWTQDYITGPLGLGPFLGHVYNVVCEITLLVMAVIYIPLRSAWQAVKDFLGYLSLQIGF